MPAVTAALVEMKAEPCLGAFRYLEAEQSFGKPLRFRAADTHQRDIERHDHQDDAEGNDLSTLE